ncbi:hypothetical protein Tco_1115108, partial [Tanacetum coccineum]
SEEFVNMFMRIGFGSTIKLVSFDKGQVVTFGSKFLCGFRNSDCGTMCQSDNMEESVDIMGIDTDLFCYESPLCLQFKEFNYLLQIDEDLFTYEIVSMESCYKVQISNEKEILGLNMDAYTYETFYCKQMREDELEAMYHVSEESAEEEEHDIDKPADPFK